MNEHRPSKNQLPELTYEQIVEGKRPPVLSGPYIPAYLVRAEIERLTRELGVFKRYYGSSDDAICERNELRAEIDRLRAALNLARNLPECSPSIRALADEALRPAASWNSDTFPNDQYARVPITKTVPFSATSVTAQKCYNCGVCGMLLPLGTPCPHHNSL